VAKGPGDCKKGGHKIQLLWKDSRKKKATYPLPGREIFEKREVRESQLDSQKLLTKTKRLVRDEQSIGVRGEQRSRKMPQNE